MSNIIIKSFGNVDYNKLFELSDSKYAYTQYTELVKS